MGKESTKLTNRLINKLYNVVQPHTTTIVHDEDWRHVRGLFNIIADTEGVKDVDCRAGEYHNYLHSADVNSLPYRTYDFYILTEFETVIGGQLTCHSAGTEDDPFSAYDMTVSMWRE